MPGKHLDQPDLGAIQFPAGGEEPAILIAVGIAQHHFLDLRPVGQQVAVERQRKDLVHDAGGGAQIVDRLEQRHQVQIQLFFTRPQQPGFLQQHRQLQHVGHAGGFRDDGGADGALAVAQLAGARGIENGEFLGGLGAIDDMAGDQRPGGRQLLEKKFDPRILIQAEIIRPRRHRLEQFGDRALMHLGILPQIERRQTPAKNPHGAEQTTEPAMGEQRRTMQMQRFHHHR